VFRLRWHQFLAVILSAILLSGGAAGAAGSKVKRQQPSIPSDGPEEPIREGIEAGSPVAPSLATSATRDVENSQASPVSQSLPLDREIQDTPDAGNYNKNRKQAGKKAADAVRKPKKKNLDLSHETGSEPISAAPVRAGSGSKAAPMQRCSGSLSSSPLIKKNREMVLKEEAKKKTHSKKKTQSQKGEEKHGTELYDMLLFR
jgi:hypothetical protein